MDPTRAMARILRKDMTDAELFLWQRLRRRQLDGFRFRRQHPIGPYIADFACLEPKLVVELDGSQHLDQLDEDAERTAFMERQGFMLVRFWNDEIFKETKWVLQAISDALRSASPPP